MTITAHLHRLRQPARLKLQHYLVSKRLVCPVKRPCTGKGYLVWSERNFCRLTQGSADTDSQWASQNPRPHQLNRQALLQDLRLSLPCSSTCADQLMRQRTLLLFTRFHKQLGGWQICRAASIHLSRLLSNACTVVSPCALIHSWWNLGTCEPDCFGLVERTLPVIHGVRA